MELSVVIPAYNEEDRIGPTLQGVIEFLRNRHESFEILVVDDGSQDATSSVAQGYGEDSVGLIRLAENQGKGAALRRGLGQTRGRFVFFLDADLPYSLEFMGQGLELLRSSQADAVIGARNLPGSSFDLSYPRLRVWSGNLFSRLVGLLLPLRIYDTQCGFKGFRGDVVRRAVGFTEASGYTLDIELLLLLRLWEMKIRLLPVRLERHHGSKVRLIRDSLTMLRDTLHIRRRYKRGEYPSRFC
ncbi:MAG: glycosyltransferase [Acidobacteriota bacterium]